MAGKLVLLITSIEWPSAFAKNAHPTIVLDNHRCPQHRVTQILVASVEVLIEPQSTDIDR
jgi:hypothetical protein